MVVNNGIVVPRLAPLFRLGLGLTLRWHGRFGGRLGSLSRRFEAIEQSPNQLIHAYTHPSLEYPVITGWAARARAKRCSRNYDRHSASGMMCRGRHSHGLSLKPTGFWQDTCTSLASHRGADRRQPMNRPPCEAPMNQTAPQRLDNSPIWEWGVALGTTVICGVLSGWPAGLLIGVTALILRRSATTPTSLALLASSTCWPVASAWTGDRRLFFAFTFWLATLTFMHYRQQRYWAGVLAAIALLSLFFLIRIQQGASSRVLWIELVVSMTLGGLGVVLESVVPKSAGGNWLVVVGLSLLAAISLFM